MVSIPPFSALRAFEATARLASVSAAASEIHVTDGAVSRAVREMEAAIGVKLFERGNRSIRPTATALALAREVRASLDDLSDALTRAVDAHRDRPVILSCEPTFLIRWLIPRLGSLQKALGEREIRLLSAGGPVRFGQAGVDLAIRRVDFALDENVLVAPFLKECSGPVCRPELAETVGTSGRLETVLLHTATRSNAWAEWAGSSGTEVISAGDIHFEHFYQSLAAAVAGSGVAIGPLPLVQDDLASGSLVAPRGFIEDGSAYALLAPRSGAARDMFDLAHAWLLDAFSRGCAGNAGRSAPA